MSRRRKGSSWKSSPRQLPVAAWQVSPRRRGLARHMLAASRGPRVGDSGAAGMGTSGSGCAHPCGNTEEKQGHGRHEIQDVDGLWGRGRAPSGHGTQVGSAGRAAGGSRKAPFILSLRSLRFRLLGPGFGLTCVEVRAGPPVGFTPSTGPSHAPFSGSSCSHLPSQRELSVDLRDPESRSRCHFLGLAVPPQSER